MKSLTISSLAVASYLHAVSATTICGRRGYDNGIDSYYDDSQGTYDHCSAACQKSSPCKSFAYGSGECHLYKMAVDGNFQADSDSPYLFNDVSCAKSTTITTTTAIRTTKTTTTNPVSTTLTKTTSKTSPSSTTAGGTLPTKSPSTSTTTTPSSSTSPSATANPTCAIDARKTCTGEPVHDPCGLGCGCTYVEGCGGSIRPATWVSNSVLARLVGVTYSACVRACDGNQPDCIGLNYAPSVGECYLYNATAGTGPAYGGALFASRSDCSGACVRG